MTNVNIFWETLGWLVDIASYIYLLLIIIAAIFLLTPVVPYHPTAQMILRFVRRVTSPVFDFFRRTFRLYRYTSPFVTPLVVILAIFCLRIFLVSTVYGITKVTGPAQILRYILLNMFFAVLYALYIALKVYLWIIIISVIVSWIPLHPSHPVSQTLLYFLESLTEPVFSFFRRRFQLHRYTAPLDFTPMIVILLIYLLQNMIIQYLMQLIPKP